jgi:hypothetical protein
LAVDQRVRTVAGDLSSRPPEAPPVQSEYKNAEGGLEQFPHKLGAIPKALPASDFLFALNSSPELSISFRNNLLTKDNILAIKLLSTNVHKLRAMCECSRLPIGPFVETA